MSHYSFHFSVSRGFGRTLEAKISTVAGKMGVLRLHDSLGGLRKCRTARVRYRDVCAKDRKLGWATGTSARRIGSPGEQQARLRQVSQREPTECGIGSRVARASALRRYLGLAYPYWTPTLTYPPESLPSSINTITLCTPSFSLHTSYHTWTCF